MLLRLVMRKAAISCVIVTLSATRQPRKVLKQRFLYAGDVYLLENGRRPAFGLGK